jgi:hypothetical protein
MTRTCPVCHTPFPVLHDRHIVCGAQCWRELAGRYYPCKIWLTNVELAHIVATTLQGGPLQEKTP